MKALFFLMMSFSALADHYDLKESEVNPPSEEVLVKKPEKHLRHESMIYDFNSTLGYKDQRLYTGADKNRFTAGVHINGSYEHPQNLLGFDVSLMRRTNRYNRFWWGGQFFNHQTKFGTITQNHTSGGAGSEASFVREDAAKNTVMGFGPGIGYRFKLLLEFFETQDTFETIDVFANAIQLKESFIGQNYKGYGLTTNYGIHKRSSTAFFYGGKISYNVASVTRAQLAEESKSERSLSLGWLSLAFEIGSFF